MLDARVLSAARDVWWRSRLLAAHPRLTALAPPVLRDDDEGEGGLSFPGGADGRLTSPILVYVGMCFQSRTWRDEHRSGARWLPRAAFVLIHTAVLACGQPGARS